MIITFFLCILIELQKCHQEINHENRSVDNPHTAILYGNSTLGYYYMNIYVGANMTKHSVIVDTASQTTTIRCDQCQLCGKFENPPYQFNETNYNSNDVRKDFNCSSFQNNRCNFASYYVEGSSIGGFYFKDKVLIGDGLIQLDSQYIEQESFESILGCTQFETGQLQTQLADGIFGLGPINNHSVYPPNLIDFIAKKDKALKFKRQFSICLNDNYGYLSVGGYDFLRQDPDFKINKIKFKPNQQYQVNLTKIAFGDQIFTIEDSIYTEGQGTFIDSGSTISYVDNNIYSKLIQAVNDHIELNQSPIKKVIQSQICFEFIQNIASLDYYQYFPKMKFIFDNEIEIYWKPQDYLLIQNQQVCIGVERYQSRIILGQNWMRQKDILFDLDQEEISIVSANCTLDQFKLQVINTSNSDDQSSKQNIQVVKNVRLPSVLSTSIEKNGNKGEDTEIVENLNITKTGNEINEEDEHSWLEILFYIFIVVITLKGLIFFGLYIMKRLGGNLYTYQQKHEKFQKLNNQIHIDDEESDERDSTENKIQLVIQQSDIIA